MAGYALRPDVPARGAVVYVAGIGGRTNFVRDWLCPDASRPVCAAVWKRPGEPGSLPGRGRELVAALCEQQVEDVVLLGHSMGALVAFEAAVYAPELVTALVMVAQYPPHAMRRYSQSELETNSVLADLAAALPPELASSREFVDVMRGVWKGEYRMIDEYQVSGPAKMPITVVGATGDSSSCDAGILREWDRYSTGAVTVLTVPGQHDFIEELSAAGLRNLLRECGA
jgi:surfactin synthase thioesterase subunit